MFFDVMATVTVTVSVPISAENWDDAVTQAQAMEAGHFIVPAELDDMTGDLVDSTSVRLDSVGKRS